jgi:hypothetical protein
LVLAVLVAEQLMVFKVATLNSARLLPQLVAVMVAVHIKFQALLAVMVDQAVVLVLVILALILVKQVELQHQVKVQMVVLL